MTKQRIFIRKQTLPPDHISHLEAVGFSIPHRLIDDDAHAGPAPNPAPNCAGAARPAGSVPQDERWDEMFNQLIEFKEEHNVSHSTIVDVHSTCMYFLYSHFCCHTALYHSL